MNDLSEPCLRPLRHGDAAAAAALVRLAFAHQDVATDPPSSALRETADTIGAWIARSGGIGMTGRNAGLVALLLWDERHGGLYCGRLAVAPAERGRGLARFLVAEAEREARRRGLQRLDVRVRLALPGNLRLFASLGFVETDREAHPGHATPTIAVLQKRLAD